MEQFKTDLPAVLQALRQANPAAKAILITGHHHELEAQIAAALADGEVVRAAMLGQNRARLIDDAPRPAPAPVLFHERAVIAVARKLAVTLLALWKTGAEYRPLPAVSPPNPPEPQPLPAWT